MNIDFRLKAKEQVISGLVMELVPGPLSEPESRKESIFLDEDAFGFLEPCVVVAWPGYAKYGHWGDTEIPVEVWGDIITLLSELHGSLERSSAPEEVKGLGFIFDDVEKYFIENFSNLRSKILIFIDELICWLKSKIVRCQYISIIGV
ncbi:hypothetical protein QWZ03_01440 [Chitinimonas viridis]|uniref:Uncharacterized protein n=1 Tax=Chitinimonas viridis TaxID=664880 RepID=A0ABT8B017_9NEIS|nr:hypothetical protein [Chitinimonas viridis]MDN3575436.1 hypothetical protein [Chitinimonas viridis]